MGKNFFLLSGFNPELPFAELRAALDLLDPDHRIISRDGRVVIADTDDDSADMAVERTAYTKLSARLVAVSPTRDQDVISSLDISAVKDFVARGSKIAVRGVSIGGAEISRTCLEREIGGRIVGEMPGLRVDLESPDSTIVFVAQPEKTYVGVLGKSKPKRFFYDRMAGKRPFSIPSAMQPDLSRCLVNLSRTRLGGRILDPFAGTGGIMIEAILLGYDVYGIELKKWIARGALKNLRHFTPSLENIIVGDARAPMFRGMSFDGIVTDPPYGRSTTIPDQSLVSLLESFFHVCGDVLVEGGRITIVTPEDVSVEDVARSAGYTLQEVYKVRIHKSLTRKVMVFG